MNQCPFVFPPSDLMSIPGNVAAGDYTRARANCVPIVRYLCDSRDAPVANASARVLSSKLATAAKEIGGGASRSIKPARARSAQCGSSIAGVVGRSQESTSARSIRRRFFDTVPAIRS